VANSSENVDEALAGMAKTGAPRVPMGTSAIEGANYPSATETGRATLVPRKNTQAGDPYAGPTNRPANILSPSVGTGPERNGARYAVAVNTVIPTAPEAAATQSSGRIVKPSVNRSRKVFDDGMGSSYI
jgi:hypothetical protein